MLPAVSCGGILASGGLLGPSLSPEEAPARSTQGLLLAQVHMDLDWGIKTRKGIGFWKGWNTAAAELGNLPYTKLIEHWSIWLIMVDAGSPGLSPSKLGMAGIEFGTKAHNLPVTCFEAPSFKKLKNIYDNVKHVFPSSDHRDLGMGWGSDRTCLGSMCLPLVPPMPKIVLNSMGSLLSSLTITQVAGGKDVWYSHVFTLETSLLKKCLSPQKPPRLPIRITYPTLPIGDQSSLRYFSYVSVLILTCQC